MYIILMGKTIISKDNRFEWDIDSIGLFYREEKQNTVNICTASR